VRILWASVAPFLGSGYGVQTSYVTPRLQQAGHDVAIAASQGLECGVLPWAGPKGAIPVFPQGSLRQRHNMDLVARHAEEFEADVIFSHYDAWCLDQGRLREAAFNHPWVPWFPIDTDDVAKIVLNAVRGLRGAAYRITQTHHGVEAMHAHGEQCAYVPAGYDSKVFYPRGKREARDAMGLSHDRFTAVMVAANSGTKDSPSRKSFPQAFQAWEWFLQQEPDALLYVHAMPQAHLNLDALAVEHGIRDSILFVDPYYLRSGMLNAENMAVIYTAADVLLNPSMGEGFGVPIVEAQACGTPVIAGDWTAMSEVTRTGHLVPKERAARYPMAGYGGDMFLPQPEAILEALTAAREWDHDPAAVSTAIAEYEINTVWQEHWKPVLAEVEDQLGIPHVLDEQEETSRQIREMIAS
jgi:glycosyltransferase involved in cell wall biosynthesis